MSRVPVEVSQVRGCTCGGHLYHRSSEPRCALLDLGDADEVQARLDEAADRVQAYVDAKNEELRRSLGLHLPSLVCPHTLTFIDDRCPLCDP